jgi:hypothetical protein
MTSKYRCAHCGAELQGDEATGSVSPRCSEPMAEPDGIESRQPHSDPTAPRLSDNPPETSTAIPVASDAEAPKLKTPEAAPRSPAAQEEVEAPSGLSGSHEWVFEVASSAVEEQACKLQLPPDWPSARASLRPTATGIKRSRAASTSWVATAATYLCGVILGFVAGKLYYGTPASRSLQKIPDYGIRVGGRLWTLPRPDAPITAEQTLEPGEAIHVGDLTVRATGIFLRPVALLKLDLSSGQWTPEQVEESALVLELKLKNDSSNLAFSPLDERFLRPNEFPTYAYVELEDGAKLGLYRLPLFSELVLENQDFDELPPGQERTYWLVAEPGSAEKVRGPAVWRVQLRAGGSVNDTYATVIGVRFEPSDIRRL